MSDRTDYNREYKRQQRMAARKGGLCVTCCKLYPRAGNVTCDACQKEANERKKRKADGSA